jgi:hypothetical protein
LLLSLLVEDDDVTVDGLDSELFDSDDTRALLERIITDRLLVMLSIALVLLLFFAELLLSGILFFIPNSL